MTVFSYNAIDEDGKMLRGTVESSDTDAAFSDLSWQGLHVISLKKSSASLLNISSKFGSSGIKRADVIEFASNIAVMLKAGIPLLTSLDDISKTTDNKYFQSKINQIKRSVEMGSGFSGAVENHADIFPDILISLIKIGEETGRLDNSMADAAVYLQKIETLMSAIKRALVYPAFIIFTTFGALLFWLIFVLPKILTLLQQMAVELPLITLILLKISNFTQASWHIILLSMVVAFTLFQVVKKKEPVMYFVDAIKLKMPVARVIIYNQLLALFCEQLRILVTAGLTIDKCLNIIADVIGNKIFERAIKHSREAITAGTSISDALKEHKIFPQLIIRMVSIGETSGTLDTQFAFLADHYMRKVDDISSKVEKMLEPIIIGVVGSIFAVIIIGLLMPIYELVSQVK